MTPAEQLIASKLREAELDGYDEEEAVIHVANLLGLPRKRVHECCVLVVR